LTAIIDVLDCDSAVPANGDTAWLDVCRRLRDCLSAEHFERFAAGMRMWASTAGLKTLSRLQSRPLEICDYKTVRRHASATNACLALSDVANAGPASPDEYHQPTVRRMRMHANNIVSWSNDIRFLSAEARKRGQFPNMATLYTSQSRTLQEGVDITADKIRKEISELAQLADAVEEYASTALLATSPASRT
jgi:hypothetical protein